MALLLMPLQGRMLSQDWASEGGRGGRKAAAAARPAVQSAVQPAVQGALSSKQQQACQLCLAGGVGWLQAPPLGQPSPGFPEEASQAGWPWALPRWHAALWWGAGQAPMAGASCQLHGVAGTSLAVGSLILRTSGGPPCGCGGTPSMRRRAAERAAAQAPEAQVWAASRHLLFLL